MVVEVGWREIKKACDVLSLLGAFIRALCHFIATAMGEENMKRPKDDARVLTAFVLKPTQIKEMWDQWQAAHSLTLRCCIGPIHKAQHAFINFMADVLECRADTVLLHVKIAISHHERTREGHAMQLQLSDLKMVLLPRLCLLTQVDPDGQYEFNAPQMPALIRQYAEEYRRIVLREQLPADMDVKGAIKVYNNFKLG
jgi:hypothetical protein